MWAKSKQTGFTIVELLIVIVVIGILAAITLIAFNGIQSRARAGAAQAALTQASQKLAAYSVDNSAQYPTALTIVGISNGATSYQYSYNNTNNPATYCVTATNGDTSYYISTTITTPTVGLCAGHGQVTGPTVTNYSTNPQLGANITGYSNQTPAGSTTNRVPGAGPSGEPVYSVITTASGQLRMAFPTGAITTTTGEQYNISFTFYSSVPLTNANVEVQFNTGWVPFPIVGNNISQGWNRYSTLATVPSGVTGFTAAQVLSSTTSVAPVGGSFMMSDILVTKGGTLYNYADGNVAGWTWAGAANNSTSSGPGL